MGRMNPCSRIKTTGNVICSVSLLQQRAGLCSVICSRMSVVFGVREKLGTIGDRSDTDIIGIETSEVSLTQSTNTESKTFIGWVDVESAHRGRQRQLREDIHHTYLPRRLAEQDFFPLAFDRGFPLY